MTAPTPPTAWPNCSTVLGHDARPAYSGMQALELVRDFAPDVVLLDLEMPDMNGFEVLAVLRPDPANTANADGTGPRIFALTGHGHVGRPQAHAGGRLDEHLVKPLSIETLCRALAGDGAEVGRVGGLMRCPSPRLSPGERETTEGFLLSEGR